MLQLIHQKQPKHLQWKVGHSLAACERELRMKYSKQPKWVRDPSPIGKKINGSQVRDEFIKLL